MKTESSAPRPRRKPMISVFGSLVGAEELDEVRSSLESQWLGLGPKTAAFEKAFASRLGLPGFVLLDSGSNSLYLAVKLLNLPPGSEVVVPSFTWVACAHAVLLAGLKPVFCDVDYETQNVTPETVARAATRRTRAVMAVHYAGLPADIEAIASLGWPVIEDAAHAVDSLRKGRPCGGLAEVGIYSFDAVKNLAMGEGGGLTARDPEKLARARRLRYCGVGVSGFEASARGGRWWEYDITDVFPKLVPSDVAAAIGLAQLRKLDALQSRRRALWAFYQDSLKDLEWLRRPLEAPPGDRHSYFTYCVRISGARRDRLARYLYERGIYTTLRYHPLHLNPIYRSSSKLPVSERLNEEALSLPLHPALSDDDAALVADSLRSFSA